MALNDLNVKSLIDKFDAVIKEKSDLGKLSNEEYEIYTEVGLMYRVLQRKYDLVKAKYNKLIKNFINNYIMYSKSESKRKKEMYRRHTSHIASEISVLCRILEKENPCKMLIDSLKKDVNKSVSEPFWVLETPVGTQPVVYSRIIKKRKK